MESGSMVAATKGPKEQMPQPYIDCIITQIKYTQTLCIVISPTYFFLEETHLN